MEIDYGFTGADSEFGNDGLAVAPPRAVDFSNPFGVVASDDWRMASPEQRVNTVPRAFIRMTEELEKDKTRTVQMEGDDGVMKDYPLFDSTGGWTPKGQEYLSRGKSYLEMAAQREDGGVEFDALDAKVVSADGFDSFLTKKRDNQPDPFKDYTAIKEQVQAVAPEGKVPEFTYDAYVDKVNAGKDPSSPALLDKDNERMRKAFDQRKAVDEFDPTKMGDKYLADVGGMTFFNPGKFVDPDGMNAAIDASPGSAADHKMMKIKFREAVNRMDSSVISEASDAADNSFDMSHGGLAAPAVKSMKYVAQDTIGMESSDLNTRFMEHMKDGKNDVYSFIEQNKEELSKEQYGMADKLTNAFWSANRSTGVGALWLAAKPFGGNDSVTQLASDSSRSDEGAFEGMGGTEHYKVLGMDFTNKGMYDLAGQVGSMMVTAGGGALIKGGLKAAGSGAAAGIGKTAAIAAGKAAVGTVGAAVGGYAGSEIGEAIGGDTGRMVGGIAGSLVGGGVGYNAAGRLKGTGVASDVAGRVAASEKQFKDLAQRLAPNTTKNLAIKMVNDPSAYIGGLQAAGMSFGQTYNQVLEQTGDSEQAYHKADMQATSDGLSAFIATAIFNRIAPGIEKGMTGIEGGLSGGLIKHLQLNKALKSEASVLAREEATKVFGELAGEGSDLAKALVPALKEVVGRSARAAGLRGYGVAVGMASEFGEEASDEALSDLFYAMQDDSTTWKGSVWDNIQEKFSQYMAAGVMGALGGGVAESGHAFVEEAGQLRKKNREERAADIQQYAKVIWDDIKKSGEGISQDTRNAAVAAGVNGELVPLANYMADDKIPVATRAKVIAEHAAAVSRSFGVRLEQTATTSEQRAATAQEKAKNAPPTKEEAATRHLQAALGDAPEGSAWNPQAFDQLGPKHGFRTGTEDFVLEPILLKKGGIGGAVITDSNGQSRTVSAKEASALLKESPAPTVWSRQRKTRDQLVANLDSFAEEDLSNYASKKPESTPAGTTPEAVAPPAEKAGAKAAPAVGTQPPPSAEASLSDEELIKRASWVKTPGDLSSSNTDRAIEQSRAKKELANRGVDLSPAKESSQRDGKKHPLVQLPSGYGNDNTQQDRKLSDSWNVTGIIEELFSQGLTNLEVANKTEDALDFVGKGLNKQEARQAREVFLISVRNTLGIPSRLAAEGKSEFAEWKKTYDERKMNEILSSRKQSPSPTPNPEPTNENQTDAQREADAEAERERLLTEDEAAGAPAPVASGTKVGFATAQERAVSRIDAVEDLVAEGVHVVVEGSPVPKGKVLVVSKTEAGNEMDMEKAIARYKATSTLSALPDTDTAPSPSDPLFTDPTAPKFFVNLDKMGQEDEFGGVWKMVDGQPLYTPAKGKSLPIGLKTVVEVEGRPDQILILSEVDAGGYAFRQVDVAKFSELASRKNIANLTAKGQEWDRNRLEKAGKSIQPLLKQLLGRQGKVSDEQFDKMLEGVLAVVAPGSNIKSINFTTLPNGEFFQTVRNGDTATFNLDRQAFVANLRSVFAGYNPHHGELYDGYVANEVARQIAAFVDEEQTHFVALREFTDAEMVSFFDSAVELAERKNKKGEVRQSLINDVFQRIAAQRVKGKKIADFTDADKFVVASETMRALNQILTTGQSTEGQSTESKRLLIALNQDFSQAKGPFKTVIELLRRYMDKLRRMAHIRFMMGQLDSNMQNMLRRQSTAYANANLKGDVDMMREKGLQEAVSRFVESRKVSAKQIGQIAMGNTEALNDLRAIAKASNLSLDDMIVLDYQKGTLALSDATNEQGLNVRSYIEKYFPATDLALLDNALEELNDAGALGMVQQDLMLAWDRLTRARELAPDFLKLIDGSIEEGNDADDKLKVYAMLVKGAPLFDNGSAQIRHLENQIQALWKKDAMELRGINGNIIQKIGQLDMSKIKDGVTAFKAAQAIGFNVPLDTPENPNPDGLQSDEWKIAFGQYAFNLAANPNDEYNPSFVQSLNPKDKKVYSFSSERLLPVHQILFPDDKPFIPSDKQRKQIASELQVFRDAILSEDDFQALSLRMDEEAKALQAKATAGMEAFGSSSEIEHDLIKARRLRAAAKVDTRFVEEEMTNYVNYLEALDQYNRTNRRFVNLVVGEEFLDSKDFGLRFQSRVYQPSRTARNPEALKSHVELIRGESETGQLFPAAEFEDLAPTEDPALAYGYNFEDVARIRLLQKSSKEISFQVLTMHPSDPLNPVFPDGPTGGVARDSDAYRLVPLPTSKDWQVQREMSSNMAYIGMMNQMQWQRMIDSQMVLAQAAERYEGTLGFNADEDFIEDISATSYEAPESFLPSYSLSSNLYKYEDSLRSQTGLTAEKLDTLIGIPRLIEMPDGSTTNRVNMPKVDTASTYPEGSYASHIQSLKRWAEKILNSSDPTRIVKEINGMQTLAGRLAPRLRLRALETLQYVEAQEQAMFRLQQRAAGLSAKELGIELRGLFNAETHALFDISIRALQLDTRLARNTIRSFTRHRRNIVREKVRTMRDAAFESDSLFFEDVRESRIDGPTLTNMRWGIDHFARSRTTRIDASRGMDLYEDLRRISFAKDGEMLVVGGPNWVWRDVPMFERDPNGHPIREDVIGDDGKPVFVRYTDPDGILRQRPLRRYRAQRHTVDDESKGIVAGEVMTERKQFHVDMDESERIAYAIQDRDNAGHFPLTSEMGEQSNTVEKARTEKASANSARSRVQRNLVNLDVERQLQNKWLTKAAMEIGLNLDDQLPTGRNFSDGAIEFLHDLVGLENDPNSRDAVVRKAMRGLFGTDEEARLDKIVADFENYLVSPGVSEQELLEPYVSREGEVLNNESSYAVKAESIRSEGRELMDQILSSIRVIEPDANGNIQPHTREERLAASDIFNAMPEVARMKQELSDAMINAGTAFGFSKYGAGTKYRKVKRMGNAPAVIKESRPIAYEEALQKISPNLKGRASDIEREIDPFELLSAMVEYKAKLEMDLIDSARVSAANGLPKTSGDAMLVGAMRTVVGNALANGKNDEIKPAFATLQNKMQELGMGELFSPAKANGFANDEQMATIALMLHGEQLGNKPVNLYQGNAFSSFNETGMVSTNHAVNLLAQNIPGILIYQPSKQAINQNQAFFGSTFIPGVDGSPPMIYVSESNSQEDNRKLVTQALAWWATQSEQAELVSATLQGASERVRVALSPITHVERLLKAMGGRKESVNNFLGSYAASLVEANPGKVSAMEEVSRELEIADLSKLLRDHFTTMENLGALSRPGSLPKFDLFGEVDMKGADVGLIFGQASLNRDILLLSEVLTNPKMKRLLDRFMFGDNLLNNPTNLENATLYKTFAAIKQMGEEAQEEESFEGANALETQIDPLQSNETDEEAIDQTDREKFESVLDQVLALITERSGEESEMVLTEEEEQELRELPPTVKSVQQWFRNRNHDKSVYGVMDERMERVFAEFQEGAFNGDPNWSGAGVPASDAMLFNLFTDILSIAKPMQSKVPVKTQVEGIESRYAESGSQVLSQLSGFGANPVVRANMPKPGAFDAESVIPGREGAPTITTWNNMMQGRMNGRMASTLNFESNRYKAFAGGLLTRSDVINNEIARVAEKSIEEAHIRWEEKGRDKDSFISYQKANADIHLSPELFATLKESFPQLAEKEAEVRRKLEKMIQRRQFVTDRIVEMESEIGRVRSEVAGDPVLFESGKVSVFNDDQRQLIESYVLREAERYSREGGRPENKRPRYKRLINQLILRMGNQNPSMASVALGVNLAGSFDALERNPDYKGNDAFRKLLGEMNLPQDIKVQLAQDNKALTPDQDRILRLGESALQRANKELEGMNATSVNPRKGGYFQRIAYEASGPWQMGHHTYVSPERNPLGRSANVKTSIVMFPENNFGNMLQTMDNVDDYRARWSDAEVKDYEFYVMKTALHETLTEYARHADVLHQSVKRQDTYINNYNPAAIIQQVTDTMALQEIVAKARLDKFAADELESKVGSQLSPEAIALLADPDTTTIYSASHVVEALKLRDEIGKLEKAPEVNAGEIKSKKAALARLNAKRRISTYKVPANFEARKDIIGHLVNNGEWVMLGQIGAEQDLKNRFYSQTEKQPLTEQQLAKKKDISIKDIVLNSLPDKEMGSTEEVAQNRMGFNEEYRSAAWKHAGFSSDDFDVPEGATRGEAAKLFADRHADMIVERINNRPQERVTLPGHVAPTGNEVKQTGVHAQAALHQLRHMVESIVLAYDKLEVSLERGVDQKIKPGIKEDVETFLKSLSDGSVASSEVAAQNVRLVELFSRVVARVEGQDSLKRLLLGLSTNLGPAELTAMKYLHHHDARVRIRFRKDYFAQLEAMRLHGYIQNGFDMKSGRSAWKDQLKREKEEIDEAMKDLGSDSMQQSIPLLVASLQGLLETRTHSVAVNFGMWTSDLKTGVDDLRKYKERQESRARKQKFGSVRKFFEAEHVDIVRDQAMVRELYALIKPIVQDEWVMKAPAGMNNDQFAVMLIEKAKEALLARAENRAAAEKYAGVLNQKFKDITDASEIMITALGQSEQAVEEGADWNKFLHGELKGEAKFVSTVPLRYAYATDPSAERLQLEEKPYEADPLDNVRMQQLSLLGGPGKSNRRNIEKDQNVFRPVNLNGISTVTSLMDDALYRLNVTPSYTALRHIVGNVQHSGPREAEISNSLILGESESNADMRLSRVALAGVAAEIDNEVANDMQNGVTNTAFSEVITFASSMYIAKALISFQQWWNQTGPSAIGYAAKKLATGKWEDAYAAMSNVGMIVSSKIAGDSNGGFNHDAKEFIRKVAPFSADRGADGMDPLREGLRRQKRHGVGAVKKYAGVASREVENWQEKGLDLMIARPERVLSRSIFLAELMAELRWMYENKMIETIPTTVQELINPDKNWHIPQEAVQAAQTKVNDHMGISDQGKKAFFFQNKTSSPSWNALIRTVVRFSNHQATTSSNASAMAPALWQSALDNNGQETAGTKRAKQEAIENIVGTMVQNSLFHAMKLRVLVPMMLYAGYMLGGDDEDEAMVKAQEKADSIFNANDEDNAFWSGLKAATIGKPGQFFQDWKDPDAAAVSAFAGLGSSMIGEALPAAPIVGAALGYFPVSSMFKESITNNVVQEVSAKLTGLDSAENKWDSDAVYIYEREQSGLQNAMALTAPTSVAYDLLSGVKLAYDAAETGEASSFDIASYLFQEAVFSTRDLRQSAKKRLQQPVWDAQ